MMAIAVAVKMEKHKSRFHVSNGTTVFFLDETGGVKTPTGTLLKAKNYMSCREDSRYIKSQKENS
jgi:hypothetical protein